MGKKSVEKTPKEIEKEDIEQEKAHCENILHFDTKRVARLFKGILNTTASDEFEDEYIKSLPQSGHGNNDLANLVWNACKVKGLKWIRGKDLTIEEAERINKNTPASEEDYKAMVEEFERLTKTYEGMGNQFEDMCSRILKRAIREKK